MVRWPTNRMLATRDEHTLLSAVLPLGSLPALWLWRLRCRRELRELSPEQMRDVGLDPGVVQRECRKPFWLA